MDVGHPLLQPDSRARCPCCGGAFDCGGMTRPFECWCVRMPALSAARTQPRASAVPAAGCLCPACYARALAIPGGLSGSSGDDVGDADASTVSTARDNSTG